MGGCHTEILRKTPEQQIIEEQQYIKQFCDEIMEEFLQLKQNLENITDILIRENIITVEDMEEL